MERARRRHRWPHAVSISSEHGLGQRWKVCALTPTNPTLTLPYPRYLIVIEHDLGQRWKMCAGNVKEFNNWTSTLSSFISKVS